MCEDYPPRCRRVLTTGQRVVMIYDIVLGYVALSLASGSALIMLAIRDRGQFERGAFDHSTNDVTNEDEGHPEADIPLMLASQQQQGEDDPAPYSIAIPQRKSGGVSR